MHHHHGGSCDCANEGKEPGDLVSLYSSVDIDRVCALNEVQSGSGKLVIKPYEQRLDEVTTIRSICDGELLFIVPFVVSVGLKAITVRGIAGACPTNLKMYVGTYISDFQHHILHTPTFQTDGLIARILTSITPPTTNLRRSCMFLTIPVALSNSFCTSSISLPSPHSHFFYPNHSRLILKSKSTTLASLGNPMPYDVRSWTLSTNRRQILWIILSKRASLQIILLYSKSTWLLRCSVQSAVSYTVVCTLSCVYTRTAHVKSGRKLQIRTSYGVRPVSSVAAYIPCVCVVLKLYMKYCNKMRYYHTILQ
uniref:PITH domain-containing protein 1 n=1 Tax=Lygus hesperus TaxID=30085 RepID=A0A0A9WDP5_LYGHE